MDCVAVCYCTPRRPWFAFVAATLLTLNLSTQAAGSTLLIGSPQPVLAVLGSNVILPCHLDPARNVQELTVEWTRDDLPEYVHLHRFGQDTLDVKVASYRGRTSLFAEELKRGNVSMKIINVSLADQGRYRCTIPKLEAPHNSNSVQLLVVESNTMATTKPVPPSTTALSTQEPEVKGDNGRLYWVAAAAVCCVLLAAALCAVRWYCQKQSPGWGRVNVDV